MITSKYDIRKNYYGSDKWNTVGHLAEIHPTYCIEKWLGNYSSETEKTTSVVCPLCIDRKRLEYNICITVNVYLQLFARPKIV